jgi:hypothetical protein
MFNLIVAVISIALIAAMAAASIFYGGAAFSQSTAQANASTLINNGQQISGAQQLYAIDNSGSKTTDITDLTGGGYLQALPTAPSGVITGSAAWALDSDDGSIALISLNVSAGNNNKSPAQEVCEEIATQGGASGINAGTSVADTAISSADLDGATVQFGCLLDAASWGATPTAAVFAYKM